MVFSCCAPACAGPTKTPVFLRSATVGFSCPTMRYRFGSARSNAGPLARLQSLFPCRACFVSTAPSQKCTRCQSSAFGSAALVAVVVPPSCQRTKGQGFSKPSKTLEESQKIKCLLDNPKTRGMKPYNRYEKYKFATTVKEFYEKAALLRI